MSENRTYFYARVSHRDQSLDRQIEAFKSMGADDRSIITDKESGKDLDRPGYQALRNVILRPGDILVVHSLDRLSRNKAEIKSELQYFKEHDIRVKIMDLPTSMLDFPEEQKWVQDMVNSILIEVLGTIAEQERLTIRKRQEEGIVAAKKSGKKFGRPKVKLPDNWDEVMSKWRNGEMKTVEAIEATEMKRSTFYKLVKENAIGGEIPSGMFGDEHWTQQTIDLNSTRKKKGK